MGRSSRVFDVIDTPDRYERLTFTNRSNTVLGMGEFAFGVSAIPELGSAAVLGLERDSPE